MLNYSILLNEYIYQIKSVFYIHSYLYKYIHIYSLYIVVFKVLTSLSVYNDYILNE